jgi:hypothetical protein
MANSSRAIVGSTRRAEPLPASLATDARLARVAGELFLMGMARVNVLLVGSEEMVRLILQTELGVLKKPITSWTPGQPFALPPAGRSGTLILRDVGALGPREQGELLEWLDRSNGTTQVISTTSLPILPRLRAGSFIDTLYYRLNTVYVDVTGADRTA